MLLNNNAIIMAAGTSSRFAPLSYEKPKALVEVKGEILIERQIKQLLEVGIDEVYIITGYKAEQFAYLREKFGVQLIHNSEYLTRNNHSSIYAARDVLRNTYICSADNYFHQNPFEKIVDESYYAALYSDGPTAEWCMQTDDYGYIKHVDVGGKDSWYMLGHAFWSEDFSKTFIRILEKEYSLPETKNMFWENVFINHISELKMKMRKYPDDYIFEFDSIDELREFDTSYVNDTRSAIIKQIVVQLHGSEDEITQIAACKGTDASASGFTFQFRNQKYKYLYESKLLERI